MHEIILMDDASDAEWFVVCNFDFHAWLFSPHCGSVCVCVCVCVCVVVFLPLQLLNYFNRLGPHLLDYMKANWPVKVAPSACDRVGGQGVSGVFIVCYSQSS